MPDQIKKTFYRYFDIDGALATLKTESIRWARPSSFNDPFDCNIEILKMPDLSDISDDEILKIMMIDERIKRIIDFQKGKELPPELLKRIKNYFLKHSNEVLPRLIFEFQNTLKYVLKDFFVICLSKELNNILLWAHYTHGHKGAVIEFAAQNDNFFCAAKEVVYQDEIPSLASNVFDLLSFTSGEFSREKRDTIFKLSALTKSTHWKYEREWRVSCPFQEIEGKLFHETTFAREDVAAVYLGCKTSEDKALEIQKTLEEKYPSGKFYKSKTNNEKYSLDFIQC